MLDTRVEEDSLAFVQQLAQCFRAGVVQATGGEQVTDGGRATTFEGLEQDLGRAALG